MRCLQHVFLRGAMALGLLVLSSVGAMALPAPAAPACADALVAQAGAAPAQAIADTRDC